MSQIQWQAYIYDGKQGRCKLLVSADTEEEAEDEAYIAGMENGLDCIEEIEICKVERPEAAENNE